MPDKAVAETYTEEFFAFSKYVSIQRWVSYYHQIVEVLSPPANKKVKKVLVIGKGDNVVPCVLRNYGIEVTTFDFSTDLKPDIIGDVKNLATYFVADEFDCILCCEVLEHLEYVFFESVLSQMTVISPYIILSLPQRYFSLLSGRIQIPKMQLKANIMFPRFWEKKFVSEEHFWEIGVQGCSIVKVRNAIKKHCNIVKKFSDPLNTYHRFFLLSRNLR